MRTGRHVQAGFSYLFVLMLIGLIGMGLAAVGTLWRTEAQRAREAELLFVGDQYRQAIQSYYQLEPAQPRLPSSIDDLLEDRRRLDIVRHMRRAWRDPMTGDEFALIQASDGRGIVGIHSRSTQHPFKKSGFASAHAAFVEAESYADWQFVFVPADTPRANAPQQKSSPAVRGS